MEIGRLLKELIKIGEKTKTDFALYMNISPSGLSQILNGKSLPSMKDRNRFTYRAANYFAEAIYSQGCYLKFKNFFPIIYDFKSLKELNKFLVSAITYGLDRSFIEEYELNLGFSNRSMSYSGRQLVVDTFCIILSDYMVKLSDEHLEFFVSLPFVDATFFSSFEKIIIVSDKKPSKIKLNYYFNDELLNGENKISIKVLLDLISNFDKHFDLNFYQVYGDIDFFILLKGELLLTLDTRINGYPMLFSFYNKVYLSLTYNILLKRTGKKITYNKEEAINYLKKDPKFIPSLLKKGIKSVYNFMPMGYLLSNEELKSYQRNPIITDAVLKIFHMILAQSPFFLFSLSTMRDFTNKGNAIAPLHGTTCFSPEYRINYIQRFSKYIATDSPKELKFIETSLTDTALFFSKETCLIYTYNNDCEKFHVFTSYQPHKQLYNDLVKNGSLIIDFSSELWNSYQDELKHFEIKNA